MQPLWKSMIAEAVGVFALCLVGGGAIMADAMLGTQGPGLTGVALAHGLILAIAVSATMNVSGGHINPAVTVAMLVTRRIPVPAAAAYIVAQLGGGMIAGVLLMSVVFKDVEVRIRDSESSAPRGTVPSGQLVTDVTWNGTPHYDIPTLTGGSFLAPRSAAPPGSISRAMQAAWRAAGIEALLTFLLVFAVFGTAVDPRAPRVGGFGIGLTVAADILIGGPLTGAAMNPARVLGTGFLCGQPDFWPQHWVYWVGPVGGAVAAAIVYQFLILDRRQTASSPPASER